MNRLTQDTVERIYAGWYGKLIGIRHGADVEGWSSERIQKEFGEVKGYLFSYRRFAADDDSNGPVFFLRAVDDYGLSPTVEQMGETLLNYAPFEHGFFWWGGYGRSTEHTAYLNLASGVPAPLSGSVELNGAAVAEQIGGQIFSDIWGLICPGNYRLAADYAGKMSSVTHGGNGIYGGRFIAACVSAAFEDRNIESVVEKGLSVIPEDCAYRRMAEDVRDFFHAHPGSWREALAFVQEKYGYHLYPGCCHIIPNGAVVVLSLLYGGGDFSRTVNIGLMCGWDTDCNVGNIGCIVGVLAGLAGVDKSWRAPVGDFLACSSTLGCMNARDLAADALHFASLAFRIAGEDFPDRYRAPLEGTAPRFHFLLPDSTHGMEAEGGVLENAGGRLRLFASGKRAQIFAITYYRPEDFPDDRYTPSFTPSVYPGQTVSARIEGEGFTASLWAEYTDGARLEKEGSGPVLTLELPAGDGCVRRIGVSFSGEKEGFTAGLVSMDVSGNPDYILDFQKSGIERFLTHEEIAQCSQFKGLWRLEDGALHGSCADRGECYTGDIRWRDYSLSSTLTPLVGEEHLLLFRVQGAVRSYAAGFAPGKLVLLKNQNGYRELASVPFSWERGREYALSVTVRGGEIRLSLDGEERLVYTDAAPYESGAIGAGVFHGSRCRFGALRIKVEK